MIVNDFEVLTNSQNRIQSIKKCIISIMKKIKKIK